MLQWPKQGAVQERAAQKVLLPQMERVILLPKQQQTTHHYDTSANLSTADPAMPTIKQYQLLCLYCDRSIFLSRYTTLDDIGIINVGLLDKCLFCWKLDGTTVTCFKSITSTNPVGRTITTIRMDVMLLQGSGIMYGGSMFLAETNLLVASSGKAISAIRRATLRAHTFMLLFFLRCHDGIAVHCSNYDWQVLFTLLLRCQGCCHGCCEVRNCVNSLLCGVPSAVVTDVRSPHRDSFSARERPRLPSPAARNRSFPSTLAPTVSYK